jgi:hypothetical protein
MPQLLKITETNQDNTENVWYKVVNFDNRISALNTYTKKFPSAKVEFIKNQQTLELEEEYKTK